MIAVVRARFMIRRKSRVLKIAVMMMVTMRMSERRVTMVLMKKRN